MAADQRRKRLNGASIAGCSSWEQYRIKKRKLESPKNDLNSKSHISLEWDGNQKKVIAKKDQIGISWRHLRPFVDSGPHYHNVLADVLTLPREIFELEDLTEVLSCEVWQTHLSENERNFLLQFLPPGTVEGDLRLLLSGEDLHFGNPFLKWGTSVCSGQLHPDAVIRQEKCLKSDKKAYYSDLQKYHDDIIAYLQNLKERWETCKDPEKEIVQKAWRSRRDADKRISSHANESRLGDLEQDATATSESCSWIADEKACSSDNQYSSVMKGVGFNKRICDKGSIKDKRKAPTVSDDVLNVEGKPKKGDKLQKRNIQQSDGAKYMSYVKISKKQHDLFKNMKQSGKSIQSRSLNRVLGNLDSLHVQPYEVFMEEEQRKLHAHWLKMAKEDLPAAYANWRKIQLQKREISKLLEQDLRDKVNSTLEDQVEGESEEKLQHHKENNEINLGVSEEEKESSESVSQEQMDNEERNSESFMHDDGESSPASPQNQSPEQVSSINSGHTCNRLDMESENNHNILKSDDASSDVSEYSGNLKTADATVSQGVPLSTADDVWPTDSMPHSYHDSAASLSLANQQANEDQRSQLIDLESNLPEEDTGKVLLHGQPDDGSFGSYPNQDRNELLQSLFKDQGMLSYHHEQKQSGLDFQPPKNVFLVDGNFSGHFQEQLEPPLPLEQGQKRQNEVFMQQNVSENVYSDEGRYLMPRQEHLPSGNVQDWTVNPVRMSAPFQHQLNGGDLLSQNWFPAEHQVRGGWSASDSVNIATQNIGSSSNGDQSLFSVLTQCSQLRSGGPFDPMGSSERFIPPRNYGMVAGGGNAGISNNLSQVSHPLDYLGGRDAATSLMPDDMGWMNMPHQNSALHDPMGKPYLRSWNQ